MVEHVLGKDGVLSSILSISTKTNQTDLITNPSKPHPETIWFKVLPFINNYNFN